ncbi:MAG: YggT family protein [Spirochaetales bacterium]|nr:YggT family protein [Spirochaetales bacterium]
MQQTPSILMAIANFLAGLLSLYSLLIWIRIILSWLKTGAENPIAYHLGKIVDPYLSWFRGIRGLIRPRFDLTPLVALAVLSVVQSLLRLFGRFGTITVSMVIALLLQTLYSFIVHPILFFFFILLVVRLYFCYKRSIHSITYIALLDSLVGGLLDWTHRTFYSRQTVNDRKLVLTSLVVLAVGWAGSSLLLRLLLSLLTKTGI